MLLSLFLLGSVFGMFSVPLRRTSKASPITRRVSQTGSAVENIDNVIHIQFLYVASVSVGTPPQSFSLQLDTGSSVLAT
jgi:hypothetical protein